MRTPVDYSPAFSAFCARFPPTVKTIVMAIIGSQHPSAMAAESAKATQRILSFMKDANAPKHYDLASVTDTSGFYNEVVLAYWDSLLSYSTWRTSSGFESWWDGLDPALEPHGWFQEVFTPSMDRVETIYSEVQPGMPLEGHGVMSDSLSGPVCEHVYWGSMRDRLPAGQIDELVGEEGAITEQERTVDTRKSRVKVPGKQNLCLIRSGQDWSKTKPEERKLYLETMHPVLIEGMRFLRDQGDEVGCYSCRLMSVLDSKTSSSDTDQTFGLAYFDDIAGLEKWSKQHKTHLDIFGGFLGYVTKLDMQVALHLYHEVFVLQPEQQVFEYVGCHSRTGMLGGMTGRS